MKNDDGNDSTVHMGPGGVFVRQFDDGRIESGIATCPEHAPEELREHCDLVKLTEVGDGKYRARTVKGPSKVTSNAYRTGWDTIFGGKQTVGEA